MRRGEERGEERGRNERKRRKVDGRRRDVGLKERDLTDRVDEEDKERKGLQQLTCGK